jgi:hypothetical protein
MLQEAEFHLWHSELITPRDFYMCIFSPENGDNRKRWYPPASYVPLHNPEKLHGRFHFHENLKSHIFDLGNLKVIYRASISL